MLIHEIEASANVSPSIPNLTLRTAIQLLIDWCDKDPEKKIVKISWLFTLRCKHLAMALRFVLGQIPE
jgi:hypothetical protein